MKKKATKKETKNNFSPLNFIKQMTKLSSKGIIQNSQGDPCRMYRINEYHTSQWVLKFWHNDSFYDCHLKRGYVYLLPNIPEFLEIEKARGVLVCDSEGRLSSQYEESELLALDADFQNKEFSKILSKEPIEILPKKYYMPVTPPPMQ